MQIFKKTIGVGVTPQATKLLSMTKYSSAEFVDWMVLNQKVSFGGHDVICFLEEMCDEEDK